MCFLKELKKENSYWCCLKGCVKEECMIKRVALVMNIVPCRDLKLDSQA